MCVCVLGGGGVNSSSQRRLLLRPIVLQLTDTLAVARRGGWVEGGQGKGGKEEEVRWRE